MKPRETFSPAQCRAARGLLNWSDGELARRTSLEIEAVQLYERSEAELGDSELAMIGRVFVSAGVIAKPEGMAGVGVRFARPQRRPTAASGHGCEPWIDASTDTPEREVDA